MKKSFITTGLVEMLNHKLGHTFSPDSYIMVFTKKNSHISFICKLIHVIIICGELSFVTFLYNFHIQCITHHPHVTAFLYKFYILPFYINFI